MSEASSQQKSGDSSPRVEHASSASGSPTELDVTKLMAVNHEPKDSYFPYNEEKTLQHVCYLILSTP